MQKWSPVDSNLNSTFCTFELWVDQIFHTDLLGQYAWHVSHREWHRSQRPGIAEDVQTKCRHEKDEQHVSTWGKPLAFSSVESGGLCVLTQYVSTSKKCNNVSHQEMVTQSRLSVVEESKQRIEWHVVRSDWSRYSAREAGEQTIEILRQEL